MTAGSLCVRDVHLLEFHETAREAAHRMAARNVGTLVVLNVEREPIGIVTDRDLVVKVVAVGADPEVTTATQIMTKLPATVREDTPIEEALRRMRSGPFRRLPVVDNAGKLVGLLSLDDILELLAEEFKEIGQLVRRESPRRYPEPSAF